jgi:hypothetical protein
MTFGFKMWLVESSPLLRDGVNVTGGVCSSSGSLVSSIRLGITLRLHDF